MLLKLGYNLSIALEALLHNSLRSFLTSLGMVFGVASVIAMLAIGRGTEQEILEQMELLGANNIIVKAVVKTDNDKEKEKAEDEKKADKQRYSPGLNLADVESIQQVVGEVDFVSPEIVIETMVIRSGLKKLTNVVGVNQHYFTSTDFSTSDGSLFTLQHLKLAAPVCVIGSGVKARFFPTENPIGKEIKCGSLWLTVVGVLAEKKVSEQSMQSLGIRDYNMDIYAPITTLLLRYRNRALITRQDILLASRASDEEDGGKEATTEQKNYHQVDRMVVRVKDTKYMVSTADIVSRMLHRRHNQVVDYEVIVPEELLAQKQRTVDLFNNVLLAIACISLIVGGIGIMNIMLASVMERIKEIGTRLAIGATKRDIVLQFISEAVTISILGGFVGIGLGIAISYMIEQWAEISTIIVPVSVLLSFSVSVFVGLLSGIFPAMRAANQDPIVSLRYE